MPGKKITDHQVQKYKHHHLKLSRAAAAAKAGISERSARRIEHREALPSQREERAWRTRTDPLAPVWDSEVVPLLQADGALNAVTLLEELQRRYPGDYGTAILRTLQRRVRQWRAVHGPEREVFFAQEHPPGRLGLSDFTVCDELKVVIAGVAFPHRIYQFALAHSGWRHAVVFEGGESFIALSSGLQSALWRLGGVPEEHRTDSLSAAFNNLAEEQELTRRYAGLCQHYGMRASRCNPGQSQENGSIESRHDSLKTALDQALRLRGSRCFDERAAYEALVATIVARLNARVAARLVVERATLRALPQRRTAEYEELPTRVSKYAIFTVRGVQYSAPSQLIGQRLTVRLYTDHIECWLGGTRVLERARLTHQGGQRHPRDIDYRHLIAALRRKPGAFARSVLRDAMFPRAVYRQTWERLSAQLSEREACKTIVGLLGLAADGHEAQLATELEQLIELDQLPDLLALTTLLAPRPGALPEVRVELPDLAGFDALLGVAGMSAAVEGRLGLILTDLRLPTIKRLALDLCAQSDREGWPGNRLLEALFEHEISEREVRRIERHRIDSALSPDKRLSSFDFHAVPSVSKAQVMALAAGTEWLDRGANVLLFGPPGVGKSHLISGLGHALIDAGRRVLFMRCSELVQRLQTARRDLRLAVELAKLDRFDLLILDDLSYVRRDQAETSVLFELIAERYERKSIAITANTPFSQWGEVFVDAAMTVAAVDRLVHHATILEMNVESYRRRAAQAAQAAQAPAKRTRAATTTATT